MTTLVDGQYQSELPCDDRGLQFGDGVFETIAVAQQAPLLASAHIERLKKGCERLKLPFHDFDALFDDLNMLCRGQQRAVAKIIITRGSSRQGYFPPSASVCRRLVSISAWPEHMISLRSEGIAAKYCETRLSANAQLAGFKHLNRLEQVLASLELRDQVEREGFMLDALDQVICGTRSNLFCQIGSTIYTPPIVHCGILGIMRGRVMAALSALGVTVEVQILTKADLARADALFITNSLIGIWPVLSLAGREYAISEHHQALLENLKKEMVG